MADFLASVLAQRRFQEEQRRRGMLQQLQQQSMMQREARNQAQQAFQQQQLAQQGGIAAGNMARTDRRLDLMEQGQRYEQERRQREAQVQARKEARVEEDRQLKLRGDHGGDLGRLRSIDEGTRDVVERINRILAAPNRAWGFEPNFGGYTAKFITQHLPGDRIQSTKQDLEALQSYLSMTGLRNLRSRTGQSVGAITQNEWPILAKEVEALSPMLGEAQARKLLTSLKERALVARNQELDLYNKEWSPTKFHEKSPFLPRPMVTEGKGKGVPRGVDPEAWDNMTPQEQGLWLGTTK